nr:putative ribonuclease h protein [Quercus suber]
MNLDGVYSMRSGYNLIIEEKAMESPDLSNAVLDKKIWKGIWSLMVPNKVKTLLRRVALDSLPTKCKLVGRKVLQDASCVCCKGGPKTNLHALWTCPSLAKVWSGHFNWLVKITKDYTVFLDVIQFVLEEGSHSAIFATLISLIWQ